MPRPNVPPFPVKESLIDSIGIATRALVRYMTEIRNSILYLKTSNPVVIGDFAPTISNQNMLCDASAGDITVTLPLAASCFTDQRSINYAVIKTDLSNNKVIIIGTNGELIVGETSQSLIAFGEVLNFITDGKTWYLGS